MVRPRRVGLGARSRAARPTAAVAGAAVALLLAAAPLLRAEVQTSVTLTGYAALLRAGSSAALLPLAKGRLDLQSVGNENVRGLLQLDAWAGEGFGLSLPRAYVKVRLPGFRLTVGKTRVSWGDGFLFNSGDVVFGSMSPLAGGLSESVLRDETTWLTALYLPLGPFSYLEGVLVPYAPVSGTGGPLGLGGDAGLVTDLSLLLDPAAPEELAGGLRGVFRLGEVKVETGYFGNGRQGEHRTYVSLQGHLGVDWYASGAFAIPTVDPAWGSWQEWLDISAGVFSLWNLPGGRVLSVRLETAVRPGSRWREAEGAAAVRINDPAAWTAGTAPPEYGLYLFPEVVFSPTDTLSIQVRALISPIDGSALSMAGASWNVHQGLSLFTSLSVMGGDANDLYAWEQDGGIAWLWGLEFVY